MTALLISLSQIFTVQRMRTKKITDEKERQVKTYGNIRVVQLFFQWAATLFWIFFLTGMTGSIIANLWRFARKRHFINDTIFMRMLLWPVLISFFVPVIFLYWQQKEGRHAFQYEMFRSAGFVTLMLSAVIIIWLAGALRRTAITLCQLNSLYQLKINAKRDLLWQEDEQKETYKLCAKMGICRHVNVFYKQRDCVANDNGIFKSMYFSSGR